MIASSKKRKHDWLRDSSTGQRQSVMFVPSTPNSLLAKTIRQCEERNTQGRNVRIKIVETSGKTVKNTLAPNYLEKYALTNQVRLVLGKLRG